METIVGNLTKINEETIATIEGMIVNGLKTVSEEVCIKWNVMMDHAQTHVMSDRETGLRHRPRKQPAPTADNNCASIAACRYF